MQYKQFKVDNSKLYAKVFKTGKKVLTEALHALGFDDKLSHDNELVAVNTLGWNRNEMSALPSPDQTSRYGLLQGETGVNSVTEMSQMSAQVEIKDMGKDVFHLINSQYFIEISKGVITHLYDKQAHREVVPKGQKANQLVIFDDKPLYWQAWDVEVFHLNSRKEIHATSSSIISENGPHRVAVQTTTKISEKSSITTTTSLSFAPEGGHSYIETEAEVDWHEDMKFLKVEFPTTITNSEASYETQYGIVRRPTHYNTTWDMAKFEVCCHKWADLSENGYGVSILNDSKYGFATVGSLMRLSLLRAPKAPDAHADMGKHKIRWAILPHKGPLDHRTIRAGFEFNNPMAVHSHPKIADVKGLMTSFKLSRDSDEGLVLDTIKRGEDDEDVSRGDLPKRKGKNVIIRVYDSLGGRCRGSIEVGQVPIAKVWKCNVLEDDIEEVQIAKGAFDIELRAFEVATYRLQLQ
jgi:alpha-mannosidase